jgi:enoyl-CoA hydratase/carnithine racemase
MDVTSANTGPVATAQRVAIEIEGDVAHVRLTRDDKMGARADMGGMLLMRELARPDVVADLTFSGRIFSGVEAERYGFATRLCDDPVAEALAAAREIAGKSPEAIRAAKRILSMRDETLAARILQAEAVEQAELMGSPSQIEAVKANLPRRV